MHQNIYQGHILNIMLLKLTYYLYDNEGNLAVDTHILRKKKFLIHTIVMIDLPIIPFSNFPRSKGTTNYMTY